MYPYFPGNMMWSQAFMLAVAAAGAPLGEAHVAGARLQEAAARGDTAAWFEPWHELGLRLRREGVAAAAAGRRLSAERYFLRAVIYHLISERLIDFADPRKLVGYRACLEAFELARAQGASDIRRVEVPYGGASLPAYFTPAPGEGRRPVAIVLCGFDITKELAYVRSRDLLLRGVSLLAVDAAGVGETLRLRGIPSRYDYEVPVRAVVDWLEAQPEVDPARIGLVGISLGGYYAPRAAAFEPRIAACACWGAAYEFGSRARHMVGTGKVERTVPAFQLRWVMGAQTDEQAVATAEQFTLEGVLQHLRCPLLVVHGTNDIHFPMWQAERTIAEAASDDKTLVVFDADLAADDHCQASNPSLASDVIFDWLASRLGAETRAVAEPLSP